MHSYRIGFKSITSRHDRFQEASANVQSAIFTFDCDARQNCPTKIQGRRVRIFALLNAPVAKPSLYTRLVVSKRY